MAWKLSQYLPVTLAAFLWLIAPVALLWVMLRATRQLTVDFGQLRYLAVAVAVPIVLVAATSLFPEPPRERYPHMTPVGFFVGIPAIVYVLAAHLFFATRALRGLVK